MSPRSGHQEAGAEDREDLGDLQRADLRLGGVLAAEEGVDGLGGDGDARARLLELPGHAGPIGAALADRIRTLGVQKIVAPALGGVIIGYTVAAALDLPFVFTERKDGLMTLRRGFQIGKGERVAIVEDVVTTGGSSLLAIERCEAAGLKVKRVLAIVDRLEGGREAFAAKGYELTTLLTIKDFGITH